MCRVPSRESGNQAQHGDSDNELDEPLQAAGGRKQQADKE